VANPGIPAGIDYRGGDLWIAAPAGDRKRNAHRQGIAIHAPARMEETGEQPGMFVLSSGRGVGERAVFDTNGESFTLGGWLYKRVST
jgi:hypothetical protein